MPGQRTGGETVSFSSPDHTGAGRNGKNLASQEEGRASAEDHWTVSWDIQGQQLWEPGWSLNSNLREPLEVLEKKIHTVKNLQLFALDLLCVLERVKRKGKRTTGDLTEEMAKGTRATSAFVKTGAFAFKFTLNYTSFLFTAIHLN